MRASLGLHLSKLVKYKGGAVKCKQSELHFHVILTGTPVVGEGSISDSHEP